MVIGIITIFTVKIVPAGSPRNFTVLSMNDETIVFNWQPPDKEKQNGNITSYKLQCTLPLESKSILTEETSAVIASNILGSNFTCSVLAISEEGEGPSSTLQITHQTAIDKCGVDNQEATLIQLYIIAITCLIVIWNQNTTGNEKMESKYYWQ